jgi:shikimate kinase
MGAGKTTVGRAVARRLDGTFFDSDHEIEARTGARIPVIFEMEGEAGFRDRESQVIAELTQRENIVLATGGGAVLRAENRECLKTTASSSICAPSARSIGAAQVTRTAAPLQTDDPKPARSAVRSARPAVPRMRGFHHRDGPPVGQRPRQHGADATRTRRRHRQAATT